MPKGTKTVGRRNGKEIVMVQLASRVPKTLHLRVRMHCLKAGISVMDFLVAALERALETEAAKRQAS